MIDRRRLLRGGRTGGGAMPACPSSRPFAQADLHHGIGDRRMSAPGRGDGIVIHSAGTSEVQGFNDTAETPNYDDVREAVNVIAGIFAAKPASMTKTV
ncbi:hypothetical protein BH10PSE13_BH10PSE13_15340 [soil metagenome]